jgi:hypothetical protein
MLGVEMKLDVDKYIKRDIAAGNRRNRQYHRRPLANSWGDGGWRQKILASLDRPRAAACSDIAARWGERRRPVGSQG